MIHLKLYIFDKSSTEVTLCPSWCIISGVKWCQYVLLLVMLTLITWSGWWCLLLLYYKVTIFLLELINSLRDMFWDYANILFLLKLSLTDSSTHGWILPTTIIMYCGVCLVVIFLFSHFFYIFKNWDSSVREDCPFSVIYVFNYLFFYQHTLMDIYFLLCIIIQYYIIIHFISQIVPSLAIVTFFRLTPLFFWYTPILFWVLPYFLSPQSGLGSFCSFLALLLKSTTFPRSPGSFYWRVELQKPRSGH